MMQPIKRWRYNPLTRRYEYGYAEYQIDEAVAISKALNDILTQPSIANAALLGYRAAMEKNQAERETAMAQTALLADLIPGPLDDFTPPYPYLHIKRHIDALQARVTTAEELLREIRDNEVNTSDEADKFLRDHQPSELSKSQARVAELEEQVTSLTNTTSGSYGNPQ